MTSKLTICARILLFALALTLAACGGGGGGSGNSTNGGSVPPPPSPPPPPPPPPGPALLQLNENNAGEAVGIVLSGMDHAIVAAEIAQFSVGSLQGSASTLQFCGVTTTYRIETTHVDADGNAAISAGDVITIVSEACSNVTHELTVNISSADSAAGSASGSLGFEGAVDGENVASGTATFAFSRSGAETVMSISDLSFSYSRGGTTETFSDVRMRKALYAGSLYEIDLLGTLDSARLGGRIRFDTGDELSGQSEALPYHGSLTLVGSSSAVRVEADRGADAPSFELSTQTGSAAIESGWSAWLEGYMFGLSKTNVLISTSLQILPHYPTTTDRLRADFIVIDFPFHWSEGQYEWRRNGTPIPGEIGHDLPPTQYAKDDLIELTARAVNGSTVIELSAATRIRNAPPVIANAAITPATAYTTDDLLFTGTIADADNDPLQVTHQWRKNGQHIPVDSSLLPSAAHARDDVITAIVSVYDGSDTVTAEAEVTIQDSSPRAIFDSIPATVTFGSPLSIPFALYDPDGDPTADAPLSLAYAPGGMAVTAGLLTWLPDAPMFTDEMEIHFGVTVDAPGAGVTRGTIRVVDSGRASIMARSGMDAPTNDDGMLVGDFDGDGVPQALILDRRFYELEHDPVTGDYVQSWVLPFALDRLWSFTAGDSDNDTLHEIFLSAGDRLLKLDGRTRREIASIPLGGFCAELEYGDLDADGDDDVVCSYYSNSDIAIPGVTFLVIDPRDLSETTRTIPQHYHDDFELGNVDSDPALEIVTILGFVIDGISLGAQRVFREGLGSRFDLADVDGDGIDEVFSVCGLNVCGYRSGTLFWEGPGSAVDNALGAADLDGDGDMEFLQSIGDRLLAHDFTGSDIPVALADVDGARANVRALDAADFDADGVPEIIAGGTGELFVAGTSPAVMEWAGNQQYSLRGPFIGGKSARRSTGAEPEIAFLTNGSPGSGSTRLVMMSPDGTVDVSEELHRYFDQYSTLDISDFDADGADEVLLNLSGELYAYDIADEASIWTASSLAREHVASADADGDGVDDFVVAGMNTISTFDSATGQLVFSDAGAYGIHELAVAELDTDAAAEFVIATDQGIEVYQQTEPGVFESTRINPMTVGAKRDIDIGDLDGDGEPEVVVWTQTGSFDHQIRVLDAALVQMTVVELDFEPADIAIERTGHSRKNLIITAAEEASTANYSGTVVMAVDPYTGTEIWRSPPLIGQPWKDSIDFYPPVGGSAGRLVLGTYEGMFVTQ